MTNPREKIVEVARRYLGIEETSPNRFRDDALIWSATSYPDGWRDRAPYCAAFVCHVVRLADSESDAMKFLSPPRSPAVAGWYEWARETRNGVVILKPGQGILPG